MFEKITDFIKESKPAQFALVFLGGITVGVLFYPTKIIKDSLITTYEAQITSLNQKHEQEVSEMKSTYESQTQSLSKTNSELSSKITSLTNQVTSLKKHAKKTYVKIAHPDGTVEEREVSEEDTESEQQISQQIQQEYEQKLQSQITELKQEQSSQISSMQKQFDSKEQSYQAQISTLTQTHSEVINPKNFGLEGGVLTSGAYYGHVTYDVWGPFLIGLHGQFGTSSQAGAGIGLRF